VFSQLQPHSQRIADLRHLSHAELTNPLFGFRVRRKSGASSNWDVIGQMTKLECVGLNKAD
jgi:hypothetical protein